MATVFSQETLLAIWCHISSTTARWASSSQQPVSQKAGVGLTGPLSLLSHQVEVTTSVSTILVEY